MTLNQVNPKSVSVPVFSPVFFPALFFFLVLVLALLISFSAPASALRPPPGKCDVATKFPCTSDSNCDADSGFVCYYAGNVCVKYQGSCEPPLSCVVGYSCVDGCCVAASPTPRPTFAAPELGPCDERTSVRCVSLEDCEAGYVCHDAEGVCVKMGSPCDSGYCAGNSVCIGGCCVYPSPKPSVPPEASLPPKPLCDFQTSQSCASPVDCPLGFYCDDAHYCVSRGVECSTQSDCSQFGDCLYGCCKFAPPAGSPEPQPSLKPGVCDLQTDVKCESSSDCPAGFNCVDYACVYPGIPCDSQGNCPGNGVCADYCCKNAGPGATPFASPPSRAYPSARASQCPANPSSNPLSSCTPCAGSTGAPGSPAGSSLDCGASASALNEVAKLLDDAKNASAAGNAAGALAALDKAKQLVESPAVRVKTGSGAGCSFLGVDSALLVTALLLVIALLLVLLAFYHRLRRDSKKQPPARGLNKKV